MYERDRPFLLRGRPVLSVMAFRYHKLAQSTKCIIQHHTIRHDTTKNHTTPSSTTQDQTIHRTTQRNSNEEVFTPPLPLRWKTRPDLSLLRRSRRRWLKSEGLPDFNAQAGHVSRVEAGAVLNRLRTVLGSM